MVYVDVMLEQDREIVLNAGTHVELIRQAYADHGRQARPNVAKFSSLGAWASAAWADRVWRAFVECAGSHE